MIGLPAMKTNVGLGRALAKPTSLLLLLLGSSFSRNFGILDASFFLCHFGLFQRAAGLGIISWRRSCHDDGLIGSNKVVGAFICMVYNDLTNEGLVVL